ncbi:MAG: hypothetical protein JST80_10465 [Bdellovibrionales bacterium]|nr:hypothetical protein [Bdellovibrionales bacterium]
MKALLIALLLFMPSTFASISVFAAAPPLCEISYSIMDVEDAFALHLSTYAFNNSKLPTIGRSILKLQGFEGELADAAYFEKVIKSYGLSVEEWRSIESVELKNKVVLGSGDFLKTLHELLSEPGIALNGMQISALTKLNNAVDMARMKVKTHLQNIENRMLVELDRFMSDEELSVVMARYTRDQNFSLKNFGYSGRNGPPEVQWRNDVMTQNPKVQTKIEKSMISGFLNHVEAKREIPETGDELIAILAERMNTSVEQVKSFIGEGKLFGSTDALIDLAIETSPRAFYGAIDKRVFSAKYEERFRKAIQDSEGGWLVMKLVEKQGLDPAEFAAMEKFAKDKKAMIILLPAFSELGQIPDQMKYLLSRPNVYVSQHNVIALNKNNFIINAGAIDKIKNPLTGLRFSPTDHLFVAHPRVVTTTVATGNNDMVTGYMMTTGSISNAQYRGRYLQNMFADFKAQRALEDNRGFLYISRDYMHQDLGPLSDAAWEIGARRVRITPAMFGNPAGFFDQNKLYTFDGRVVDVNYIPAIVPGDLHLTATDPAYQRAFFDFLKRLNILAKNPKYGRPDQGVQFEYVPGKVKLGAIFYHDFGNGTNLSHWIRDTLMTLSKTDQKGLLDLVNTMKLYASYLNHQARLMPDTDLVVVIGNHDHDWLMKILEKANFRDWHSPGDLPVIARLFYETAKSGKHPFEALLRYFGVDRGDGANTTLKNIIFVDKHENYRAGYDNSNYDVRSLLNGVQLAKHMDKGQNGGKSISDDKIEESYEAAVGAHNHRTGEAGLVVRVGAFPSKTQDYHTGGPSSSDASVAVLYSKYAIQLWREVNWTFSPNAPSVQPWNQFAPSPLYPVVQHWPEMPEGGGMTDQLNSIKTDYNSGRSRKK